MLTRIFAPTETHIPPSAFVAELVAHGYEVEPHFKGDDLGWTSGQLILPGDGSPIQLERWLTKEDNLREDLNSFAAELETMDFNPNHTRLMQLVIQAQQLIAIRKPIDHADDSLLEDICEAVTTFLARHLDAIYQVDGAGWYAANGELLLPEY